MKCYYDNKSTEWGCTQEGDAYFHFQDRDTFDKGTELVTVDDATSGKFRFGIYHYFDYYVGDLGYPKD